MNLYIRYFNDETLAKSLPEVYTFLSDISGIRLDEALMGDIEAYVKGGPSYPKRFKISSHLYFIMIKTSAASLEEFKARAGKPSKAPAEWDRDALTRELTAERPGWYNASLAFKRVVPVADNSGKFRYVDTDFEVRLKAHSVQDCYNRVIDHLRRRADVDPRSQFPSIKGRNFKAEYQGMS